MTAHVTWYAVSELPDRIESSTYDEGVTQYKTAEEAGDAIVGGFHGDLGTRYVLAVDVSVAAVWERPWTLVQGPPEKTTEALAEF